MSERRPVVHLVDDDESVLRALTRVLRTAGFEVRAHRSAGDLMLADDALTGPGCLVLDLQMPGPSGLDLQAALARREAAPPIVFLTGHGDVATSVRALKAGAVDFLTKPVEGTDLIAAVRAALERDRAARAERAECAALRARFATLTARERDVLARVVAGRLNKQIAADLAIAERTVKAHRAQVMAKMRADSLADLVRAADRLGIVRPA